ncbi:SDR family oxidoreductase [Devosia sp. ZB163]|uniref:SDR family oxidoreductase n=1 Tax=Devosia sp. ZB163 TaxID=3025938 RepID=UPI00235EAC1E|nr:SDR family oxidoreductase [Devosia sp. ZB163]MDC9822200.1 SDR family oxidoreductase [Devosia sp. ZB163]
MTQPTLFVAGAGGKLGRRVVELLRERGYPGKIIAGSRHPEKLDFPGVETRKADFSDPAGFTDALAGVDRVLIISTDVIGEARIRLHTDAVAAARAAGVKRILYTSLPHPEPGSIIPMAADHYATEQAIKATGIDYTILRNSWYTEGLLGSLPAAIASGKWYTAAGEGLISHVSREDTAKAAAGALIADAPGSRVFTITGPEALTVRELAAIASEVTGKPIEVVDVSDEQYAAGLQQAGFSADLAALLTTFEIGHRRGLLSMVTDAVEELWGEKPTTVREFLTANRAALTPAA